MNSTPQPLAELHAVDVVFDALAHAARRQILLVLLARGETMTSKEIAERFSTTWATVSRHLKTLEAAGLVEVVDSEDRRQRVYRLEAMRLRTVAGDWIKHFDQSRAQPSEERQP